MTYSIDLKERVIAFVRDGGSKIEAARRYKVSRKAVYNWLGATSLEPKKQGRRKRKLDWAALQQDIDAYPDKILKERATAFGVHVNAIWYAAHAMKNSNKKNAQIRRTGS
jgi:transposase